MDKEFVTYEVALALKELGFDEPCLAYYDDVELQTPHLSVGRGVKTLSDMQEGYYKLGPLYQQVFRWFRENYGWIGGIRQLSSSGSSMIVGEFRKDDDNNFILFRDTYEEVENACIDELIEIAKQQDNGMESNS
jgi:GT2 family glycosyltransferase